MEERGSGRILAGDVETRPRAVAEEHVRSGLRRRHAIGQPDTRRYECGGGATTKSNRKLAVKKDEALQSELERA